MIKKKTVSWNWMGNDLVQIDANGNVVKTEKSMEKKTFRWIWIGENLVQVDANGSIVKSRYKKTKEFKIDWKRMLDHLRSEKDKTPKDEIKYVPNPCWSKSPEDKMDVWKLLEINKNYNYVPNPCWLEDDIWKPLKDRFGTV